MEDIQSLFDRGVALENNSDTQIQALNVYLKLVKIEPRHSAAHINIGTIYLKRNDYALAEKHYRLAIKFNPNYALAHFNLGNILDYTDRLKDAITSLEIAVRLEPTFADAHYNLALAYQNCNCPGKAIHHWLAYTKLDLSGPWHNRALVQLQNAKKSLPLKIVRLNLKPRLTKRRAKLKIVK